MTSLDQDRLFPIEPQARHIARELYYTIHDLPIISPHGHTDPAWFATNASFSDPARLFVTPDHYILRMLFSQGIAFEKLGVPCVDGYPVEKDGRKIWRLFAENYFLFRGTPSQLWIDHALSDIFDIGRKLDADTADDIFDEVAEKLSQNAFRPRALYDRFRIEVLATTDNALDTLQHHKSIHRSGWGGRIIPTYRPDAIIDPDKPHWSANLDQLADLTNCDTGTWQGYLDGHRARRRDFIAMGATATDHGHPDALTAVLPDAEAEKLFDKIRGGNGTSDDHALFRAQMLTEMAAMSIDDGLVMQLHAGSLRNHAPDILARFGADRGFDIPQRTDFVTALRPLLMRYGLDPRLTLILFTLDETTYSRELAPLAGAYPALRLGPAWWFFDSPEGMIRYRQTVTETAGFYNTVGFNDDTRAFCSIPARHDVARRVDAAYLATLVATGRLGRAEADEVAQDLTYDLAKQAYRL
ncbi:MAG: glucuronate isomerase [Pseudomonadota bacterium]